MIYLYCLSIHQTDELLDTPGDQPLLVKCSLFDGLQLLTLLLVELLICPHEANQ